MLALRGLSMLGLKSQLQLCMNALHIDVQAFVARARLLERQLEARCPGL